MSNCLTLHTIVTWVLCLAAFGVVSAWAQTSERTSRADRTRRIIVNDDGEVGWTGEHWKHWTEDPDGDGKGVADSFLAARFQACIDTQVDSYFFNIAGTDRGPWGASGVVSGTNRGDVITNPQSSMAQFFYWGERGQIHPITERATRTLIDAARQRDIEVFASIRMNDHHDAGRRELNYPLKVERPDLLLDSRYADKPYPGRQYPRDAVLTKAWCGLDYAKDEVRGHFLEFIEGYCRQYDYDGVELDFWRHPHFFKHGEELRNIPTMTQFVRRVRKSLNDIGTARGRPYLLTVRTIDWPDQALRAGLNVEQWLKEGLLDLLIIGGGYMPYSPRLKAFIDIAHEYGVPAYPVINHFQNPVAMRSLASNFWALGADGVYLFNYAGVEGPAEYVSEQMKCLVQMGDPADLLGLNKRYLPNNGDSVTSHHYGNAPRLFPVYLVNGTSIPIVVGDDLEAAQRRGLSPKIQLTVTSAELDRDERIAIQINRHQLADTAVRRVADNVFKAAIDAAYVHRGVNQVVILPGPSCAGRLLAAVTGVELSVRYGGGRK